MSSDTYQQAFDQHSGLNPSAMADLHQVAQQYVPDYNGSLYAPISYDPGTSPLATVNPYAYAGDKEQAQKISADTIRAQYADYQQRFQPLEDMAVGLITPTGTKDGAYDVARSKETIGNTFQSLQGQQDRSQQRFGLAATGNDVVGSKEETSAMVGGINAARVADQDRRLKLLGGGTSSVASAVSGSGS